MRILIFITAWLLALLGGFFALAGAQLAWLDGSPYYLITGIAMIASGALIGRHHPSGRFLFLLIWLGTALWALWEVGWEPLELMPRVLAPTVLLALVYLPALFGSHRKPAGRRTLAGAAVALLAIVGLKIAAAPQSLRAQAPLTAIASADPGDWTQYGGTLAGDRFSTLDRLIAHRGRAPASPPRAGSPPSPPRARRQATRGAVRTCDGP